MGHFRPVVSRRAALISVPVLAGSIMGAREADAARTFRIRCSAYINLRTPVDEAESETPGTSLTSSVSLGGSSARSAVGSNGSQRANAVSSGLGMSYPAHASASFWQAYRVVGNVLGYPLPTTFNYTSSAQLEAFTEAGKPGSVAIASAYFGTNAGSSTVLLLSQNGITWPDRRGDANMTIRSQLLARVSLGASIQPILPEELKQLADHASLDLPLYETTFAPKSSWDALRLALLVAARELGIPSLKIRPGGLSASANISVQLGANVSAQLSEAAPIRGPSGLVVTGVQASARTGSSGFGSGTMNMQVAVKSVALPRTFSPGTSLTGMFLELPSGSRVPFVRA